MTSENEDIIDCMARMKGDNQPFALATVVNSKDATSAKAGAKAIIRANGAVEGWIGGGCSSAAVRKAAAQALIDGKPRMIRISPEADPSRENIEEAKSICPSGGTLEVFVEPVLPRPAIVILGASPVAQTLCGLAKRIGYAVTAVVLREDQDLMEEANIVLEEFNLEQVPRLSSSYLVVATQGKRDMRALESAVSTDAQYVAFVSSKKKAAKLKADLKTKGFASDRVDTIRSPAGLNIGGVTPEEIALSVLADIVKERRLGSNHSLGDLDNSHGKSARFETTSDAATCCNRDE